MRLTLASMLVSMLVGAVGLGFGLREAGLSLTSAVLVAAGVLALVAVPILLLAVQVTTGFGKVIALARRSVAYGESAHQANAKIAWQTAMSRATASSVGRMAPIVRGIDTRVESSRKDVVKAIQAEEQTLRKVQQHLRVLREEAEVTPGRTEALGPFAPGIVHSSKMTAPQQAVAGRVAAARPDDVVSGQKLALLLDTDFETPLPRVSTIATPRLAQVMESAASVHRLYPSYGAPSLPAGTSYLVIEDRALVRGPWAGATQATGTLLFRDIYDLMRAATQEHVVVAYIETGEPPGHFTMSIKELATVTIRPGQITGDTPGGGVPTVLRALATNLAREEGLQ